MPLTVNGQGYRDFSEPRFFECETEAQVQTIRAPVNKSHAFVAAADGTSNLTVWKFDKDSTDAASATVIVPDNPEYVSAGRWISLGTTGSGAAGVTSIIAGTGISVDQATGDVTVTNTGSSSSKRVVTLTDAATVTVNSDTTDIGDLLTLSQTTNFANPTGAPTDAQAFVLRIKSTTARALTWGAQFRAGLYLALPTTTSGSSLTDYFGFIWNAHDSKWDFAANIPGY